MKLFALALAAMGLVACAGQDNGPPEVTYDLNHPRLRFTILEKDERFQDDFLKAAEQWSKQCGLVFSVSLDPAAEGVPVFMDYNLPKDTTGAQGSDTSHNYANSIRFNANIQLRKRRVGTLAHEIGHALGFRFEGKSHTPGTVGLMSAYENEVNYVTADLCQYIE